MEDGTYVVSAKGKESFFRFSSLKAADLSLIFSKLQIFSPILKKPAAQPGSPFSFGGEAGEPTPSGSSPK
jgi:hypothetical protein